MNTLNTPLPYFNKSELPDMGNTLIGQAIAQVEWTTSAPKPMIAMSALMSLASITQGLINVKMPVGSNKIVPVSLIGISIARSGERKSTVESIFFKKIKEVEASNRKKVSLELDKYEVKLDLFESEYSKLKKTILRTKDKRTQEQLTNELISLKYNKPQAPKPLRMTYEDTTIEALLNGLRNQSPNALLHSSEGGTVLSSQVMANTAKLNAIWSGDQITIDRKSAESFSLDEVRLSISLMVQQESLNKYLEKRGEETKGNGFWSRALITVPESKLGNRPVDNIELMSYGLSNFYRKQITLLSRLLSVSEYTDKEEMVLSVEARQLWINTAEKIESEILPNGRFFYAPDHASKLSENILRIAATIHYFETEGDLSISLKHMQLAINLALYFSNDYIELFSQEPLYIKNAKLFSKWISEQILPSGKRYLRKNNMLQRAPNSLRKAKYLNDALAYLEAENRLKEMSIGKTKIIDLYPQYSIDKSQLFIDTNIQC